MVFKDLNVVAFIIGLFVYIFTENISLSPNYLICKVMYEELMIKIMSRRLFLSKQDDLHWMQKFK